MSKKSKKAQVASEPNLTLAELSNRYLRHMEEEGKSAGTCFSYGMELKVAQAQLSAETPVAALTAEMVEAFNTCDRVMKLKNGKPKAEPSFLKTRRVLRLALVWAEQAGLIAKSPITPKGEAVADEPVVEPPAKPARKGRSKDVTVVVGDEVVNDVAIPETAA